MTGNLIIVVGDVTYGDDGVAQRVAELLEAQGLPADTRLIKVPALGASMAGELAETVRLVVVDAGEREAPAVTVETLAADPAVRPGRPVDAAGLLEIAFVLYGVTPRSCRVSVAAPERHVGEGLSAEALAAAEEAARTVMGLLGNGTAPVAPEAG